MRQCGCDPIEYKSIFIFGAALPTAGHNNISVGTNSALGLTNDFNNHDNF